MPIHIPTQTSAPVFFPKSNYAIVKYLDLTKYISILQRQSLFFCRVDKLEDKFEGTTAKPNFDARINWYKYMRDVEHFFKFELTDDDILKRVKDQYAFDKQIKGISCVNCWNKKDDESAALWKIYSDFSKGIMIKSSISNIQNAFNKTLEEIQLSEIKYIDYEKEEMPDGNSMFPLIHKHRAYSYEDEVRLIFETKQVGWEHDWENEEVEEGIYLSTDINLLIEEIIISPYSANWFYKLVEDISHQYGLKKPISKSKLSNSEK